jgi:hypothetical protein
VAFGFTGDEQERRFEFLLGEEREESVSAKKNQIVPICLLGLVTHVIVKYLL